MSDPAPAPPPSRRRPPTTALAHALKDPGPLVRLVWVVLAGVPVLWIIEYTGPRWLNLVLRGMWVVLASIAVVAAIVTVSRRRTAPPKP